MTHSVIIIDTKQLADGLVAVQACCCGDPGSLSWLSMASEVAVDPVKRQNAIDFHVNRVAQLHETTLQALTFLPTLVGTASTVSFPAPVATSDPAPAPVEPVATAPSTPDPASNSGTSVQ